jgi:hypothetical protein
MMNHLANRRMAVAVGVATFFAVMGPLFEAVASATPIYIPKLCCCRYLGCFLC